MLLLVGIGDEICREVPIVLKVSQRVALPMVSETVGAMIPFLWNYVADYVGLIVARGRLVCLVVKKVRLSVFRGSAVVVGLSSTSPSTTLANNNNLM